MYIYVYIKSCMRKIEIFKLKSQCILGFPLCHFGSYGGALLADAPATAAGTSAYTSGASGGVTSNFWSPLTVGICLSRLKLPTRSLHASLLPSLLAKDWSSFSPPEAPTSPFASCTYIFDIHLDNDIYMIDTLF